MMVKLLIVWKRFWRISHSLRHVLTEQSDQQTAWFITTYKLDSKHYDCNNNAYPRFPHYFSYIMAIILIRSGQKGKQRSTKHTNKTKDRVTRTPLKNGCELMCSGRVSSSWFTSNTHRVNLVTTPVISHERWKDREVLTTRGTYPWSVVTQIFHNGQPSHGKRSKQWFQHSQ
jgi:hypothetical protein